MTRKKYSKEFKLDAVTLGLEQGYSTADAARSLDLRYSILNRWVNEHKQNDELAIRRNGKLIDEQLEIRRLNEQDRRLEMVKGIVKKAPVGLPTCWVRIFETAYLCNLSVF